MKANDPQHQRDRAGAEDALRKSELRYRRLFETAQDGILILDGETGAITDANPYLLDLLGYPFEDLFGRHLWEIGEFKDVAASKAAFAVLQSTEFVRYENLPLQTRSGDRRQVEFVSNVYDVDGDKVIQCNIREISARTEVEQAARSHLVGLEYATQAKDNVLAIVSHELRTPLAAISSMLDVLAFDHSLPANITSSDDAARVDISTLASIRRNVGFLSRLTDQLSDITHVTNGAIHLESKLIDAHQVISEVVEDLEGPRALKEISINMQLDAGDHHLHADATKFHQIVSNLIGNALKFTPAKGVIDVATYNPWAGQIIILIHDSGIGFEAKDMTRIFSPFEQADASIQSRYGGLGLGLSITKSLVEAHGGKLTAESRGKNLGATFILEFKSTPPPEAPSPPSEASPRVKISQLRILFVEDHDDTRDCLTRLLQSRGHNVSSAGNVQEAVDLTNGQKFDLLVTDVELSDGSGWNLLQTLKLTQPALEAIILSGYEMPEDLLKSKEAGFAEYLLKPVFVETLDAAIAKVGHLILAKEQNQAAIQ